ncbi:DUF6270 domain-containing protein [Phenylobacterium sp.]|uniref:DUF6270 domain-containing protein n=1 Tax=Phenylobacterium sp. TaxID=1871053 RepID=UPI0025EE69B3|nr:DUF6270 domain-containing protein [Phenylobacterium sp.]
MPRIAPRIAIVGSCITRDLWPIHGGGAEALLYISRTSFPSLLAAPVEGFRPARQPPGDLHRHEHNAVAADLQKTALARLVAFQPTHLIFDFIDERFDLLAAGGSIVTHSAELERSGYRSRPALRRARTAPRLSAACERLWLDAAGEFAAVVRATPLARARPILHGARWASDQRLPDGRIAPVRDVEILSGQSAEIAAYNALLERQEAAFAALMPPMARIDADAQRLADPTHRWGLSPFHYVPEYYDEVRRQLAALGLEAAFSDPRAAPSAPAG